MTLSVVQMSGCVGATGRMGAEGACRARLKQVALRHRPLLLGVRRVVVVDDVNDADVDDGAGGAAPREFDQVSSDAAIAVGAIAIAAAAAVAIAAEPLTAAALNLTAAAAISAAIPAAAALAAFAAAAIALAAAALALAAAARAQPAATLA